MCPDGEASVPRGATPRSVRETARPGLCETGDASSQETGQLWHDAVSRTIVMTRSLLPVAADSPLLKFPALDRDEPIEAAGVGSVPANSPGSLSC
jgi:hypothetical protein